MSFEQIKAEIEAVVIQPLLAFHGKTSPLNQIHNDNTRDFSNIIAGLLTGSDGETAFQGDGSMALADLIGSYLNVEQSITGSGTDFVGHLLEAAQDSERTAHQLQQELNSIAAQQDHTVQSAAGIAIGLDTGAVAQGGIDIPWDIVAAGATLVAAGLAAAYNADQEKSQQAQMAKYTAIAEWSREMGGIASEPLAQLPPSPTNANGDSSSFLKILGLGTLLAASGTGSIDESDRKFSPEEKLIADVLSGEGKTVKSLPEPGTTRVPDASVDGVPTEFKTLNPGASDGTVKNVINNSIKGGGQARDIVIDARGSGLTAEQALKGLARAKGIARGLIDSVRIIGDGFDIISKDFK